MKTPTNCSTKSLWLFLPVLLAGFIWTVGCAGLVHHPDPLAGWRPMYLGQLDQAIVADYEAFIQKLPPKERILVDDNSIWPYENGTGGHAVKIRIFLNGTILEHDLFYDQKNKRITTVKYSAGKYSQW
jgi:hypothetical protein